jgi:hypothetical protein
MAGKPGAGRIVGVRSGVGVAEDRVLADVVIDSVAALLD